MNDAMKGSRSSRPLPLLAALAGAAWLGCSPAPETPGPGAPPGPTPTPQATAAPPAPAIPPSASPEATAEPGEGAGWTLGPQGAGPVRFGMSVEELRAAVEVEPLGPAGECAYVVPKGAPDGLAFMVVDGRVVRADIRRGSGVPATIGVRTGDDEARALERLGPATEVRPHKYVEGHYLTAPTGEGETWWVVETDRGTVTDLRAGLMPQVRWVEGCS